MFYTVEMILNIIALGFYKSKHAYLRNNWNIMDFIVVMLSWVTLFMQGNQSFAALRALKAFRTLRMLSVIPSLGILAENLLAILPLMRDITFLCLITVLIFATISI